MLTKLRSLPSAEYKCCLSPAYLVVRLVNSSPMLVPSTSTESSLSVKGRSGVGIRILVAIGYRLFVKRRPIVFQSPGRQQFIFTRHHRHDHIREERPGMIEIVLRRLRRVIRVRVIKPE